MLDLDVRSVILISGILSLLMAVVLFFLRRNYPASASSVSGHPSGSGPARFSWQWHRCSGFRWSSRTTVSASGSPPA
jgi:hypothetical protein